MRFSLKQNKLSGKNKDAISTATAVVTPTATVASDDECSMSSTIAARSSFKTNTAEAVGVVLSHKKQRVRFADEATNDTSKTAANACFAPICWYSPEEYIQFKKSVMVLVKKLSQGTGEPECRYRRVMTSAFTSCCHAAAAYEHKDEVQELEELHQNFPSCLCLGDQLDLHKCLGSSSSICNDKFIGLDRMAVPVLQQDLLARRRLVQQQLFAMYKEKQDPETIRRRLEVTSRPSQLYAVEKARALAPTAPAAVTSFTSNDLVELSRGPKL